MGRISQTKRTQEYCKIAGQLSENPDMHLWMIAQNVGMSRNTVAKYLKRMYTCNIVVGPWISLKPHENYEEYVYLMKFSDSFHVYRGLKGFPHVLYHGMTFGDWNTLVVTDRLLDFSQLVGFRSLVYQGVKGYVYTPKIGYTTWDMWLKRVYEYLDTFSHLQCESENVTAPPLPWGKNEWMLYHAFRLNMRKKVISTLQKLKIRYETYSQWLDTLQDHCTIHAEFYPEGLKKYMNYCFLLKTDYNQSVISLLSLLPTTPVIMEVGDQLLVSVKVVFPEAAKNLICMLYDLKARDMIKGVLHAIMVSDYTYGL